MCHPLTPAVTPPMTVGAAVTAETHSLGWIPQPVRQWAPAIAPVVLSFTRRPFPPPPPCWLLSSRFYLQTRLRTPPTHPSCCGPSTCTICVECCCHNTFPWTHRSKPCKKNMRKKVFRRFGGTWRRGGGMGGEREGERANERERKKEKLK